MFGSDWNAWGGPRARMPDAGPPPPAPATPITSNQAAQRKLFEDTLVIKEPVFAVGVSHCPWLKDRAANMEEMRPILQGRTSDGAGTPLGARVYYEETERAPNHVWSRKLWGWAASQPVTHGLLVQDDIRISPEFWRAIFAMVRAVPNRIIGLISNHPLSPRALNAGHAWIRMCETLGTAYIVPTAIMGAYLEWYDALDPAYVAANCEDFLFSQWVCKTGRKTWCPIPTVLQTRDEIPTSNPKISYPFRKSYITWEDPRVAGKDITSVDYWKPKTLPPDFGHAVSQDTRYPPGPFTNDEVLAAHNGNRRLNVYPPAAAGLQEGLDRVLAGSYDILGLEFAQPPTIIDGGANVGSFTVFAADRWRGARIFAYEPSPDSAVYCRKNVDGIATLIERAIVGVGGPDKVKLYEGVGNTGQRSIYQLGEQRGDGVIVETIRARELPPCDILKLDTEGVEVEALRDYLYLSGVKALMLEWHRKADYDLLLKWLPKLGFKLVRDDAKGRWVADRNLIFVRDRVDPIIACPGSSLEMLLEQEGYRLGEFPEIANATILDIGGHVGTFTLKALGRWAGSQAITFEPHPETFDLLKRNTEGCKVEARNVAVVGMGGPRGGKMRLYEGVNGRHECSLRDDIKWGPDQTNPEPHVSQQLDKWVDVDVVNAANLPPCDVLKVDCEGLEVEILQAYPHLPKVKVLVTEAHAVDGDLKGQAARIRLIAEGAGLKFVGPDPVVARFVRP